MENIAIKKVSASFFEKKEAKKLPLNAGRGRAGAKAPRDQKFWGCPRSDDDSVALICLPSRLGNVSWFG
jgi:hypothetical protein